MGKRRKRGWHVCNFDRPRRKKFHSVSDIERSTGDSKVIFKAVCLELEDNCGKQLDETMGRGLYSHWQRSRGEQQNYYNLRRKGNNLLAFRQVHLVDGKPANLFLLSLTGVDDDSRYESRSAEILRRPISQWKEFIAEFKALTPDLEWFEREQGAG